MKAIATIHCGFSGKFGVPRQSGLACSVRGTIVFQPEYRDPNALRGLDGFSHIWLIWEFSESVRQQWSPTVRPPRLGGNTRLGVFATRSPFRPNPIGLSCVKLDKIDYSGPNGPVLHISGADLMDGTPIYDIKPYIPYCDCLPHASAGFTAAIPMQTLSVSEGQIREVLGKRRMSASCLKSLIEILEQDPRPRYQDDPDRSYTFDYDGWSITFKVNAGTLTVTELGESRS